MCKTGPKREKLPDEEEHLLGVMANNSGRAQTHEDAGEA